jgi:acyl-CoA thioester hydrolase
MPKSDFSFHHSFRVRWGEVDPQGVVFNARYLDYADIGTTEYWRATGWRELYPDEPFEFHVRKASVLYEAPITPDEMIQVMVRTSAIGRTSMTQQIEIHGLKECGEDDLRATIELIYVFVDLATHRPAPLPQWIGPLVNQFDALSENSL